MSIGNNIKKIRDESGLSQKEFAEVLGVSDRAVSMWEVGKREPRMGIIQKISDCYGITKSEIIEGSPSLLSYRDHITKNVPVFETITSSADIDNAKGVLSYELVNVKSIDKNIKFFFLLVRDNEMSPVINYGDIILVAGGKMPDQDGYAAVSFGGGRVKIKRVRLFENNFEIISENPYFPKQTFSSETDGCPVIMGAAVRLIRNFCDL